MPDPVFEPITMAASYIEGWVQSQGITMADVKRNDQRPDMVRVRRLICHYLREHGWSYPRIGEFIDRDHTTVYHLLGLRKRRERDGRE